MAIINGTNAGDFITGTNDGDTIFGLRGDDTITGGRGNDVASMGGGNDQFVWNPGDGSDTVLGDRGFDTLVFNGANIAERFDILGDGHNTILTRDVGAVTMALGSVERIELATLGGNDAIHVGDLVKSATTQVAIDLGDFTGQNGDGAVDTVTVDGRDDAADSIHAGLENGLISVTGLHATTTIVNAETTDVLKIDAQGGNDTIDLAMQVADAIHVEIEGGAGTDTARLTGSDGDDTLTVFADGTAGTVADGNGGQVALTDVEHLVLDAGKGGDMVTINDLTGTSLTQVSVDLGSKPAADADTVVVQATQGDDMIHVATKNGEAVVTGLAAEIDVAHAGKNDVLIIDGLGGADLIDASKLTANMMQLQISGGDGDDRLIGSAGNDVIDGDRGNDVIQAGAGDDRFVWNPGDGSDAIDGGGGTDTMQFNGANIGEHFQILADGDHVSMTRDIANIAMDLQSVERIELKTLGGSDSIAIGDLTGTGMKAIALDLGGFSGGGDGATDSVTADARDAGSDQILVTDTGGLITVTGLPESLTIANAESADTLTIGGLGGNDTIDASGVPAGAMQLTLDGGAGNDVIFGSAGADLILGGDGSDTVKSGAGGDQVFLGNGDDIFNWQLGDGSDLVEGDAGLDTMNMTGGKGDDAFQIFADGSNVAVTATDGAKVEAIGMEQIKLDAGAGKDNVTIGDLSATGLDNLIVDLGAGSKGDIVTINGGSGEVMLIGTSGNQTVITNENTFQTITLQNFTVDDVLNINGAFGQVTGEVIEAGGLAASLHFLGTAGADTIFSGSGNDFIDGNQGSDVALMGAGNDTFNWDPGDGSDAVDGQAGTDTLQFNGANIAENIEVLADGSHAEFTRDVANITMHLNSVERIDYLALGGADHIHVTDLTGSGVKEVAIDLAGMRGGTAGDGALDTVTIEGSGGGDHVTASSANGVITVTGFAATTTVAHADSTDVISINGNDGKDTINASGVEDGIGRLSIDGGAGDDTITGGHGGDLLFGGDGHDILNGGDGADTLDGGSGDDVLTGGKGDDTLIGGDGADTFNYTGAVDGHDVIVDFSGGDGDRLNLTKLFDSLHVNAADREGRVSIIDNHDGTVSVSVDGDGNKGNGFELSVATLHTHDPVTIGHEVAVNG